LASAAEITWNAFNTATAFGATVPLAIVVEVIAFPSTDVELEVDCSIRTASVVVVVVVVVVEMVLDVEVDDVDDEDVVDEDVDDELDVDVSATSVVLVVEVVDVVDVVDVVEVVDVVVDVVVVSGVAEAASDARLRPFTFSAFTVMA
jgi:hypothetical protein